jgi:hypothetical protein
MKVGPDKQKVSQVYKLITDNKESEGKIKYQYNFTTLIGLQDFESTYEILFVLYLKHSSIWPLADVKPISDDLVDAKPW